MAIDVSFEGLVMIVLGVCSGLAGLGAWVMRNGIKQTQHEDKLTETEKDIIEIKGMIRHTEKSATEEHQDIRNSLTKLHERINKLCEQVSKLEGRLEK